MRKIVIFLLSAGLLSAGLLAFAEDTRDANNRSMPTPTHVPASSEMRAKMKDQKDQIRQNIKDTKTEFTTEIKDLKTDLKNRTANVKEDIKKRKEEFNDTVKAKQAELEDKVKAKREELKVRLEKIKDERKKETVEKIDERMDALNDKMLKHFSDVLNKLEDMLVRINQRADRASSERGLDVSSVRSAIDKAKTTIAAARSAIEAQTGKTYKIQITTESGLRTDVGKARQSLGADLAKVKDAVKAAQSAVKDAAVALARLVGKTTVSPSPSSVICIQDVKLCPDGSFVGRAGPNCEFKACPGETVQSQ